jgi:hypothetical protein
VDSGDSDDTHRSNEGGKGGQLHGWPVGLLLGQKAAAFSASVLFLNKTLVY